MDVPSILFGLLALALSLISLIVSPATAVKASKLLQIVAEDTAYFKEIKKFFSEMNQVLGETNGRLDDIKIKLAPPRRAKDPCGNA